MIIRPVRLSAILSLTTMSFICTRQVAGQAAGYNSYLIRSKDLANWELSPFNPILEAGEEKELITQTWTSLSTKGKPTFIMLLETRKLG